MIELLVVLVILGLSTSLLAPDMYGLYKRMQAKNELNNIKALVQLNKERSFFSHSNYEIRFSENEISAGPLADTTPEDTLKEQSFRTTFYRFDDKTLVINRGEWQATPNVKLLQAPNQVLLEISFTEE